MATRKTAPKTRRKKKSQTPEGSCFVLMPFKDPFDKYYEQIYVDAIRDAGLEPRRVDEVFSAGTIIRDIWDGITRAGLATVGLRGVSLTLMRKVSPERDRDSPRIWEPASRTSNRIAMLRLTFFSDRVTGTQGSVLSISHFNCVPSNTRLMTSHIGWSFALMVTPGLGGDGDGASSARTGTPPRVSHKKADAATPLAIEPI